MGIAEQVQHDLKQAMKDRDADRTRALRMIRAALLEAEKAGKGAVADEQAVEVLRRIRKQRTEAAEQYRAGGRPELAAAEEAEMGVIDGYLPRLADEATTRAWVHEAIAASGAKAPGDVGRVMGALMKAHRGEVDAALARGLAQQALTDAG